MTERKPAHVGWEPFVERQIRESMERGEFDNLPGQGEPIPDLDRPRDDLWWVKEKLRREQASDLPPALAIRRELDVALERIAAADREAEVRRLVAAINDRIVYVNSHTVTGPPSTVMPLDVEQVVEGWCRQR